MIRHFVLIAVLLLAGCAGLRGTLGLDSEEKQVVELVGYAQRIATMPADEQRREYAASTQAFGSDKGAYSRLRLALLLAMPGAILRDDARASGLLEPLVSQGEPGPLKSLAGLLYAQIGDRQREQKRADLMRDQLEALKDVERTLIERGQQRPAKRR